MMLNFGKKEKNTFKMVHYEGLPGFPENVDCNCRFDNDALYFLCEKNKAQAHVNLSQITAMHYLHEIDFMRKYHNVNSLQAKNKGLKVNYLALHYIASDGKEKYIALFHFTLGFKEPSEIGDLRQLVKEKRGGSTPL